MSSRSRQPDADGVEMAPRRPHPLGRARGPAAGAEPEKPKKFLWFHKKTNPDEPPPVTTVDILAHAVNEQEETVDAVKRMEHLVAEAEDVGQGTSEKLQQQHEQVTTVDDTLANAAPTLSRAKQEATSFARALARDKCFLGLLCLVVSMVVVIIVYSIVDGGASSPVSPQWGSLQTPPSGGNQRPTTLAPDITIPPTSGITSIPKTTTPVPTNRTGTMR